MNSTNTSYFIRHKGQKEFKIYQLINVATFNLIDMDFSSKKEAEKYLVKKGYTLVVYEENVK